jgi:hypothetical protein
VFLRSSAWLGANGEALRDPVQDWSCARDGGTTRPMRKALKPFTRMRGTHRWRWGRVVD